MAFQPELTRPELQRDNANRNGLNIQQPGEGDWKDTFGLSPEDYVDHSKTFSLSDVLPAIGTGAAQSVQGSGEMARGLGDALIKSPLKTGARILSGLTKMGVPGPSVAEIFPDATRKTTDDVINALPDGKNAVTDAIGTGLKVTGKAVSGAAGSVGEWTYGNLTPGAQRALNTPMIEGWDDSAVWVAKGANLIGTLIPDLAAGGITRKVGEVAIKKTLGNSIEKKMIAEGLAPEKARILAQKSVEQKMPDLFRAGLVTSSTVSAQGASAMNAAEAVLNADYSELLKSPKFQEAFYAIDDDPQYAELSDSQKLDMAKERVADVVRSQLATDVPSLVVNALAARLGDGQLVNLAWRGMAKSMGSGIVRTATEQAGINAVQGGFARYQENAALRDTAGMDVPEWQGVRENAFESGVMGSVLGAPTGTIAGHRGKRQARATEARQDTARQVMEEKASRAREMAENSPYAGSARDTAPLENYRQQYAGLSRDELLQHYADAEFASAADSDAVYRRQAANELLRDMDHADALKGVVEEMRAKPRNAVLAEFRTLNEKDSLSAAEEMRLDAAREVLKPQPDVNTEPGLRTEQPQPSPDISAQNTARGPLYDADNLDVPAFMRDPRFRDFTDEPTEVQQHLTRRNAPTPEELVQEQMAKGDAGPTDSELAERPRLPSPGDIHPGQGYPLPGEVRQLPDEAQAGRGGRYTTTGEVQGQRFEKAHRAVAPEGVPRQGETLQGEQSYQELPAPERQVQPRSEHDMAAKAGRGEKNPSQPEAPEAEKTTSPHTAADKSGQKIDDFGETLHGAAKHRRAELAEALSADKTAEDYRNQPLSKLFPKPEYARMAAEGTDSRTTALLALLRSSIPARPRASHRLNRWAEQVREMRDIAGQLLDGSLPADKFIDRIRQEKGAHYRELVNTWEMLRQLAPEQLDGAAGYRIRTGSYSMYGGKNYDPPKIIHTLVNEKGRTLLSDADLNRLQRQARAYFDQQTAAPAQAEAKTKLDIYRNRRTGDIYIGYGRNKTLLQGGFKTVAEAREYATSRRGELLDKLNALREKSREEQRNPSNRERTGPERRQGGRDVTPEQFSEAFGFRGVQFGNYVEGPRRQADLNRAYDALTDMAEILKVPPKALSLNGRLGLAFGARGKGGSNAAAAHYEPGQVAINLTKGNGAGSLAHEWFHSLDNYFGQHDVAKGGNAGTGGEFMTHRQRTTRHWQDGKFVETEHPVRQEVYDAFKDVMKAVRDSGMPERSARLDDVRSKPYWSTDIEMAARAFERHVQDRLKMSGVENDYLVNIRKADDHGSPDTYAYPTAAELDGGIRKAFDRLFSTLKTRETDRGVAFYSRKGIRALGKNNALSGTGHSPENSVKGSPVTQVSAVARNVMKRIGDPDLAVRVVKTQAEAAALAGESLDAYGQVHAFYRPDAREIVLVADNLPDSRSVREKMRHEIIHHALEQVVTPAEFSTIVRNVLKTRESDNPVLREAWKKVDASYAKESPEVQAGEFLAHMAEKPPGIAGGAWNRVVEFIKAVLKRTGLLQPSDMNDAAYIRDTLRTLGQRVREGYRPSDHDGVSYSRSGRPDPFTVPEGEGERYRSDLANMMKSLRSGNLTTVIGRTPPVLRHLGAPDLPLMISRDTVRKATNGVKHDVPMEVIERLPELMHDPEAVYRSATENSAVVVLLNAADKNGDPVVTAVHMNATQKRIEINRVASVYGTKGGMSKANSMDKAGLALYRKEKLSRDNPQYSGLQLPKEERSYHGSVENILSPDDIRKGPYYSRSSQSALSPEETLAARFVRQLQDKFQVLKAVQDNIRKTGGRIDDSNNAYQAEELFHGKAENDLNVMKERYIQPLAKMLAEYDIPQAALDEYLYARHAPERNAHIAGINSGMPDGGSGMSNAEAAGIMDSVRRSGKQAQYERLAGIVDDMLARRRELIVEAGLEDGGVVDAWQSRYRYYVPLKGQDADGVVLPRAGKGFTIGGKESKQAMGRSSKALSPSTQAMQDLTESLIRHRKNEVGNTFLKLVQDNPDPAYWQVFTDDKPDTSRVIVEKTDPVSGEKIHQVEERAVPMAMLSDKYFTTKKGGKTYYIRLHDERLMRAMKNMGPETGNAVIQTLGRVNRLLSAMNTTFSPEFLVSNFVRDVQTAVMNLKAEQGRDDGKINGRDIAMKTVRDSGMAMKAVYASLRDKKLSGTEAQWQKAWNEFVEDGAKTGWFRMNDLNGRMKEMDRLVTLAKGGWQGQGIQAWNSFFKLVEDGNNAVENSLRLSAYKHARDAGLSRAQAASLAKNMTVNFNRRGEQGVLLNSLYMFANASIQGTANMLRSLAHLNGDGPLLQRLNWKNLNVSQKVALAATGAGYLLGAMNRAGAGEDDDGVNWYDKVPDYVKEHNLVIMKSVLGGKAGEYWSIPLPYGYNMFFLLGNTAEGVTRGSLTGSKAAGNIVGGVLGSFNPLGSEDSKTLSGTLLKNAAPTIFRPVMNLAMNENFMGAQIYQENFPGGTPKPESTMGRRSTPEAYRAFANWLNTATGGSQYRSGAVDINPDKMKFWIDYVSGGMGRFVSKSTDAVAKSLSGIDIPAQQVPFLGKISGQVMPYADQQKMYDRIDELRQYDAELKSLRGEDRTAFLKQYGGQISMNGIIRQSESQLKNLRQQRNAVYADTSLSPKQQSERVKAIEVNMKKVVDRFNREYQEKVKP